MFSWRHPPRLPIVVAHRGSRRKAPENTLSAFRTALREGADAVEFDVQMTRDGRLVVIHDRSLDRTTDGRGRVEEKTLAEIRTLSAGRWFGRNFFRERIPTLEEAIGVLAGQAGINIELKPRGHSPASREALVDRCMEIVSHFRHTSSVLISSFDYDTLARVRRISPGITIGVLYNPLRHFRSSPSRLASGVDAAYFFCQRNVLTPRFIRNARTNNLLTGCYTVNTPAACDRLLSAGVDVLISDCPGIILRHLNRC